MDLTQEWLCRNCSTFNNTDHCRECTRTNIPFLEDKEYRCDECELNIPTVGYSRICVNDKCEVCPHLQYEVWLCPRCNRYVPAYRHGTNCGYCQTQRPNSEEEFVTAFKLACQGVPLIANFVRIQTIFLGYRFVDYTRQNIIGRTIYYHYDSYKGLQAKITSIRTFLNCIVISLLESNGNISIITSGLQHPSSKLGRMQLYPTTTWNQIKLLFIAYYKEPESPFAQLSYEMLHYLLQFLLD